jgi:agmatine deiminase
MTRLLTSTPRADGFRMPGEFEPQSQVWMLWPQRTDTWHDGAKPAQRAWVETAKAIARFAPVTIGVNHDQFENARGMLPPHVRVVELSSNDAWMRDCGPIFVKNDAGEVRLVDWDFNAWGGLYDGLYFPWDKDDMVPRKVAEIERVDRYKAPMVLEGGAITVDGQGTLITTEECLLSPGRNPELTREQIEQHLGDYLGVDKVIWLPRGVDPDETNGHVDGICFYVSPGVVALSWTDDTGHPLHEVFKDARAVLESQTDARGRAFDVRLLPVQAEQIAITEQEAASIDVVEGAKPRPAGPMGLGTYANVLICNGGVVVPVCGDPVDDEAVAAIQALFPDREVVTVPGREVEIGGGNVHCITQQQPRAVAKA